MASAESHATERRSRVRYSFALDLEYRAPAKGKEVTGGGKTVNLSSRGVLIAVAGHHQVAKGLQLEVTMEWPILLAGAIPLQLRVVGTVVRSDASSFAVSFLTFDFRTKKKELGTSADPIRRSGVA
jgi:hypothetical protein